MRQWPSKNNDSQRPELWHSSSVLVRVWIVRGLEFDPQGRADQIEFLAEPPFQEALVGIGDMLQRIAVNDDHRRIHSTLVCIAHLRTVHSRSLGGLELHGL